MALSLHTQEADWLIATALKALIGSSALARRGATAALGLKKGE
jgi:hypothetical protein